MMIVARTETIVGMTTVEMIVVMITVGTTIVVMIEETTGTDETTAVVDTMTARHTVTDRALDLLREEDHRTMTGDIK